MEIDFNSPEIKCGKEHTLYLKTADGYRTCPCGKIKKSEHELSEIMRKELPKAYYESI